MMTLLELHQIFRDYIQHSIRVRILFPLLAYTRDDLQRKLDHFQSFGKGCQIIRRAEFLEEVRYYA